MDIGIAPNLESRFTEHDRPVLLSGIQALVRVLLEQRHLDRLAGRNTAGLVTGYRGSPLGGLDRELWHRQAYLDANEIKFQPGLNEDMAATMLWGSQQLDAFPGKKVDGVFGMWYGKGHGVDRTADVFRSANMLGTSSLGGVLAVSGDDHAAQSSTHPHQTDHIFQGCIIPILFPADVQDILDFGLAGIDLSRFSGLWVAMKTIAETAEQASTVIVPHSRTFLEPEGFEVPGHGLGYDPSLHFPRDRAELERRVMEERLPAAMAWARTNKIDRLISGGADATVGVVTSGKAHPDALHALGMLGMAGSPQVAVYKVGMAWPLEAEGIRDFARGKRVLIVIEEKRGFVETQLKDALYHLRADERPDIFGKTFPNGEKLFPAVMELAPEIVAGGLSRVMRIAGLNVQEPDLPATAQRPDGLLRRVPAFCAGCPHGTSTQLPDGSFATAGIGCHFMAQDEGPNTRTFTQMGGEGATWLGMAPFMEIPHMFANMGDGTYQHSGYLAIRQAIAAEATMTFKILVNDAVAMTGGQPAEGHPTAISIAAQVAAEGAQRIAVVADDADRLPEASQLPKGATRHVRDDLDAVQRELRTVSGVSVLIYDQVCATEKRRRRKAKKLPEATRHVIINEAVCENCGDCTKQSSCIAIEPSMTELGRKRRINPTSCNVDLSCLKGFCPSFVTMAGPPVAPPADHSWQDRETEFAAALPAPVLPAAMPWRGLFAGIGGGGIVTSGEIVAMAAHIEAREIKTLHFTGLAQKNGAVVSHIQIGAGDQLDVVRIPMGTANVMLAADMGVAAGVGVLERCRMGSAVIGNLDLTSGAQFKHDALLVIDAGLHRRTIERVTGADTSTYLHANALAEKLFGNAQAMNTLLLGLAWQRGLVPVGEAALLRAIELNGAAVKMNLRAFLWGRILAVKPELAEDILHGSADIHPPSDLSALIAMRSAALVAYQNEAYAAVYRLRVQAVVLRETEIFSKPGPLARAAAEAWFRVMGYKDEYEVARLHTAQGYDKATMPVFHLGPPLITRVHPITKRRQKIAVPGWVALPLFRMLRHGKRLRGSALDLFGRQEDRRAERAMILAYDEDIRVVLQKLSPASLRAALAVARWPDQVRGFGPVKLAGWHAAQAQRPAMLAAMDLAPLMAAAE
ncbi:MAG: indolepyruvate ferredoxin oxidoreductase family protein [Acetobacteraceae bacterium]|nr:indolepyruvate ferredoxin oxidoreductase family protein [Acetobacteraceae bacterium]